MSGETTKSKIWKLSIVVLVVSLVLTSGVVLAKNPDKGNPGNTTQGIDDVSTHCYYGSDDDGNPTGVSTIDLGETCADGTVAECDGTQEYCDDQVGYPNSRDDLVLSVPSFDLTNPGSWYHFLF